VAIANVPPLSLGMMTVMPAMIGRPVDGSATATPWLGSPPLSLVSTLPSTGVLTEVTLMSYLRMSG